MNGKVKADAIRCVPNGNPGLIFGQKYFNDLAEFINK
jgi:hypothetical protein